MQNITNFLFWEPWLCLFTSIKNDNANLQELWCSSKCKKWTPFLTSFLRYCKYIADILQTCYFEYFENAWSCPSIMTVSPCRKLLCWKCWNQIIGNFHAYLHAKNRLLHSLLSKDIAKKQQFVILSNLGMPSDTHPKC